jgi:K+-sensing histidine kinase KdpD
VLHFGSSCPARKGSPLRRGHDPPALHGRVVDAAILFLALVTWACFQLGLNLATTDFGFLIAIVLLSHFDGFVSSVFFSIIAVGCLDYFFMEVASIENATVLAALLVKSLAITGLMRRPQ